MGETPYCIDPQLIIGLPSYDENTHDDVPTRSRRRSTTHRHQVYARPAPPPPPLPTPQSLLEGTYSYSDFSSAPYYAPHYALPIPPHVKPPHIKVKPIPIDISTRGKAVFSITTTVESGQPWPSLMDILRSQVVLDNAPQDAFEVKWKRTRVAFEWPGLPPLFFGISCTDISSRPLTLDAFTREVAVYIIKAVRRVQKGDAPDTALAEWRLRDGGIHIESIRVRGFRYYGSVWVPLLGVSME